jgi:hemerythrin-like domain-containing protein
MNTSRRRFLLGASTAAAGLSAAAAAWAEDAPSPEKTPEAEDGVAAAEDLMREHGVLDRLLLIYEEVIRRISTEKEVPITLLHKAADLIRRFVEDYHEKLEEKHVFPVCEKRAELAALTKVLREQHQAGRRLTDAILRLTSTRPILPQTLDDLQKTCRVFIRMYRPHAAREDTVVFPALHELLAAHDLEELGESFEDEEERRFGRNGFQQVVAQVAAWEKQLGIYELAQFTPAQLRS